MILVRSPIGIPLIGLGTDRRAFYSMEPGAAVCVAITRFSYLMLENLDPHMRPEPCSEKWIDAARAFLSLPASKIDARLINEMGTETEHSSLAAFLMAMTRLYRGVAPQCQWIADNACLVAEQCHWDERKSLAFASAFGGVRLFRFMSDDSVDVIPSAIPQRIEQRLGSRLMFFYISGHMGGKNKNGGMEPTDLAWLQLRRKTAELAELFFSDMEDENYANLGAYLDENWKLTTRLDGQKGDEIESLYQKAKKAGALGGALFSDHYLILYAEKERQASILSALGKKQLDLQIHLGGAEILWEKK